MTDKELAKLKEMRKELTHTKQGNYILHKYTDEYGMVITIDDMFIIIDRYLDDLTEEVTREYTDENIYKEIINTQDLLFSVSAKVTDIHTRVQCLDNRSLIDFEELRHRFGEEVEAVVRDMVTGEGRRWKK